MKLLTRSRLGARGWASAGAASALVASALLLPSGPAQAAEPATLEIWGGAGGATSIAEADGRWTDVFPSNVAGSWLVTTAGGDLRSLPGIHANLATFPPTVDAGNVVDGAVVSVNAAWAVLADGTLHKWGTSRGAIANQSWTTTQLGGEAVAVGGGTTGTTVLLRSGALVWVDASGVTPVTLAGTPVTGAQQLVLSAARLADGSVLTISAIGEATVLVESSRAIADISRSYAVSATGSVYQYSGSAYSEVTNVPETEGTVTRVVGGDTFHAAAQTDDGEVVVWRVAAGETAPAMAVPAAVADGQVRELLNAPEPGFAAWMAPDTSGDPVTVDTPASLQGLPVVGEILTGTPATFTGGTRDSETSGWFIGDEPIAGANGNSYEITVGDIGKTITFRSTATKAGFEPVVSEASVGPVTEEVTEPVASTTAVSLIPASAAYGTARRAKVVVSSGAGVPAGTVDLSVAGRTVRANLSAGTATVTLPTLNAGRHAVVASYSGDDGTLASQGRATAAVSKASTRSSVAKPSVKKKGKLVTIKVATRFPAGVAAGGKTQIVIKRGSKTVAKSKSTVARNGVATFKVKKLTKKGKYKVAATYGGTSNVSASKASSSFRIR